MRQSGVEHPGGKEKQHQSNNNEECRLPVFNLSGRNVAIRRARIFRVDLGVDQTIEPHCSAAGTDHGDADPEQLTDPGQLTACQGGEYHPHQREGKGKDGVGKLDHL